MRCPCHTAPNTANNAAEAFQHDVGFDVEENVRTYSTGLLKVQRERFHLRNSTAFAICSIERLFNMFQQDD